MSAGTGTPLRDVEAPAPPPRPGPEPRPFYWSIRREMWENRSIALAPPAIAAVVLFGSFITVLTSPHRFPAGNPDALLAAVARPLSFSPAPIMLAAFIVGLFYSLDALYGERRDRSILFWKSMPVSDRTAVLSKAAIPIVVLPLIAWTLSVVVQVVLLFAANVVLVANGISPFALRDHFRFGEGLFIMAYGLGVHALWFAPIYCWLLLISAWAKRAPFLWAVLPPFALAALERALTNTSGFAQLAGYRVTGAMTEAFTKSGAGGNVHRITQLDPGRFLTSSGLWLGLIFAAAFLAAAIRLRRAREPI